MSSQAPRSQQSHSQSSGLPCLTLGIVGAGGGCRLLGDAGSECNILAFTPRRGSAHTISRGRCSKLVGSFHGAQPALSQHILEVSLVTNSERIGNGGSLISAIAVVIMRCWHVGYRTDLLTPSRDKELNTAILKAKEIMECCDRPLEICLINHNLPSRLYRAQWLGIVQWENHRRRCQYAPRHRLWRWPRRIGPRRHST